ncbi:hypothetical protein [Erwinia pyrifoliae]|uniref:hypothetical protein n=1 Tax=Erwinia pyrifoliae TaxID=79967 RepID=UPI0012FF1E70|nr:hypothetical protein [Erwinia pyrifoliae]MCT2386035.1 hypothetical protein [Erwinia pyrifoliae]UWS29876.1 hypothetical protein NYP81_18845 [Erwinia pyrifoliae]UXK12889.1 hypothetical protein NYP80_03045 [Erwinia pyrifoliae]
MIAVFSLLIFYSGNIDFAIKINIYIPWSGAIFILFIGCAVVLNKISDSECFQLLRKYVAGAKWCWMAATSHPVISSFTGFLGGFYSYEQQNSPSYDAGDYPPPQYAGRYSAALALATFFTYKTGNE